MLNMGLELMTRDQEAHASLTEPAPYVNDTVSFTRGTMLHSDLWSSLIVYNEPYRH